MGGLTDRQWASFSVVGDALKFRKHAFDLLESPSEFIGLELVELDRTTDRARESSIRLKPGDSLLEWLLAVRATN